MLRRTLMAAAAAIMTMSVTGHAQAEYPERPITLIVPWDAGGGTDIIARIFAAGLESEIGVPVNVVNRSGGSGVVGHSAIANANPDGYTLGVGSPELAFLKTVGLADITPDSFTLISRLGIIPAGVTVDADAPWQTLPELIEDIRTQPPGTYSASGAGQGGAWHIALGGMLTSLDMEPDRVRWIPSAGGTPALQDVMAGGVTMFTGSPVEARSLLEAGQVRSLAVMVPERSDVFPDVPTLAESVGSDWTYANWFAFIGPNGLPDDIVEKLVEAGGKAASRPEVHDALIERGVTPLWEQPQEAEGFAREFAASASEVLSKLGLAKE
jgi:tripartite-type tricarboxylate transporter receptor subunit TctC